MKARKPLSMSLKTRARRLIRAIKIHFIHTNSKVITAPPVAPYDGTECMRRRTSAIDSARIPNVPFALSDAKDVACTIEKITKVGAETLANAPSRQPRKGAGSDGKDSSRKTERFVN